MKSLSAKLPITLLPAKTDLFAGIRSTLLQHQCEVVKGLGKLIGTAMLFDTLHDHDYSLDNRVGEQFSEPLREKLFMKGLAAAVMKHCTDFEGDAVAALKYRLPVV